MNVREVVRASRVVLDALPPPIEAALERVTFLTEPSPTSKTFVNKSSRIVSEHLGVEVAAPADARGLYVGTQLEEQDEDDESLVAERPHGVVFLFAENLTSEEEVATVLCHEIGHALGMSEDEVDALGLV